MTGELVQRLAEVQAFLVASRSTKMHVSAVALVRKMLIDNAAEDRGELVQWLVIWRPKPASVRLFNPMFAVVYATSFEEAVAKGQANMQISEHIYFPPTCEKLQTSKLYSVK